MAIPSVMYSESHEDQCESMHMQYTYTHMLATVPCSVLIIL